AESGEAGEGVPVRGDFLLQFRAFQCLLGWIVGPGNGKHGREQPYLVFSGFQPAGEGVAGVVSVVPVPEPVGALALGEVLVVAGTESGQQLGSSWSFPAVIAVST